MMTVRVFVCLFVCLIHALFQVLIFLEPCIELSSYILSDTRASIRGNTCRIPIENHSNQGIGVKAAIDTSYKETRF